MQICPCMPVLYCTPVLFKVLHYKIKNVFFIACMFFMYYLCEKYKPIAVQYYRANHVSWVPGLTLLDLETNWTHSRNRTHSFVGKLLWNIAVTTQLFTYSDIALVFSNRIETFSSVQFSRLVVSDSLWPHESQHARPPCPSPAPRVYSNWCPSSWWCHPAISYSVVPFSSCSQSLPALGSFPMSQLFAWGGQS